jgi:hypothetical protein
MALLHNTPESNRQSAELSERDEPNPKRGKTLRYILYYNIHRLPRNGPDHQQRVLSGIIGAFER